MKIRLIKDINFNSKDKVKKDDFIEVSEDLGNYLIEKKKAVLTGFFSIDNLTKSHLNFLHL